VSLREVIAGMQRAVAELGADALARQLRIVAKALRVWLRGLAQASGLVWTANAAREAMARLRAMLARLTAQLTKALGEGLTAAAARSMADAARFFEVGDLVYLGKARPLQQPQATAKQIGTAREGIYVASLGRFGAALLHAAEAAAVATVLLGRPRRVGVDAIALAIRREAASRAYELRRIAETETSAAYNAATMQVLLAQDVPEDRMLKRLVASFDSRTGRDSVMLHGQVRPVRETFFDGVNGHFFMAPPNRPNDRELMVGQRSSWPISAAYLQPDPEDRPVVAVQRPKRAPGQAVRKARNLRAGDVLAAPGRPRVAHVSERGGRIAVQTEQGLLLYFAAGTAIGVLATS
jgi:hypothetical protein